MIKHDKIVGTSALAFFASFLAFPPLYNAFITLTTEHAFFMSGVKFAILATFGEVLGKRIATGSWSIKGFGLLPKMVVWFVLGVVIKATFIVFAVGDLAVLSKLGLGSNALLNAFAISIGLNFIFAPVFMTLHKITDMHIADNGGSLVSLIKPINMAEKFSQIDWKVQYGFVFKKTIPLFWVPMHTITFLLPPAFQVLFAAMLGIALGVILALAGKSKKPEAIEASA